jgi:heme exporter protein D
VLTTPQLIALAKRPERTVDYRLTRLRGAGLVDRTRPYAASGSAPYFWWLTRSGARLVEGTSPAPGKATPNPLFLRHTSAIAGLYVALLEFGPTVGMKLETWLRDEVAWEQWSPPASRAKHLRPDAYLEVTLDVDGQSGRAGAFVEVDFATMDQARLRAKVARHREYAADGTWWQRHPCCPALLLLTTSEARVTRVLANAEKDRPRPRRYADEAFFDYEELVAAAAQVHSPEAALSAPCWRTSAADAPVALVGLLSAEVRKCRRLVAAVRAQRAREERWRQVNYVHGLARDTDALANALDDDQAAMAVRQVFEHTGIPWQERWAAGHLELVLATHRWWVEDDGQSGWPPPPTTVVRTWRALHRELWAAQAKALLANTEAIAVDDPRLRRPAAALATGQLVRGEWALTLTEEIDRHAAELEAATAYEARRAESVAGTLRQLPFHRRIVTSEAALSAEYDARHLVICADCGIPRHERDRSEYEYGRCPLCHGRLLQAAQGPEVPPDLAGSLAAIEARLGAAENRR